MVDKNAESTLALIRAGGRNRGKQQQSLRTKALMRDHGTRPKCRHTAFVRTKKHCGNLLLRKNSIVAQSDSNLLPLGQKRMIFPLRHRHMWSNGETVILITGRCSLFYYTVAGKDSINLGSLALIPILRIPTTVGSNESILQYQKPRNPADLWLNVGDIKKSFTYFCYPLEQLV